MMANVLDCEIRVREFELQLGLQKTSTASLQRDKTSPNECPGYDIKPSDGEASVILEFWGMQTTSSLTSLPGPLCPGVVAPDRFLSTGQIELFDI